MVHQTRVSFANSWFSAKVSQKREFEIETHDTAKTAVSCNHQLGLELPDNSANTLACLLL